MKGEMKIGKRLFEFAKKIIVEHEVRLVEA